MAKKLVSIDDVKHIAGLSMLEFNEEETKMFQKDLDDIVSYFEILSKVDTSKVNSNNKNFGILRDDEVKPSSNNDDIIKNAPEKSDNAFIAPRVVE